LNPGPLVSAPGHYSARACSVAPRPFQGRARSHSLGCGSYIKCGNIANDLFGDCSAAMGLAPSQPDARRKLMRIRQASRHRSRHGTLLEHGSHTPPCRGHVLSYSWWPQIHGQVRLALCLRCCGPTMQLGAFCARATGQEQGSIHPQAVRSGLRHKLKQKQHCPGPGAITRPRSLWPGQGGRLCHIRWFLLVRPQKDAQRVDVSPPPIGVEAPSCAVVKATTASA